MLSYNDIIQSFVFKTRTIGRGISHSLQRELREMIFIFLDSDILNFDASFGYVVLNLICLGNLYGNLQNNCNIINFMLPGQSFASGQNGLDMAENHWIIIPVQGVLLT